MEYINDDIYDIHQALYIHIHICLWDLCTFLLHTVLLVRIVMTLAALIIMTIVIDLHTSTLHTLQCLFFVFGIFENGPRRVFSSRIEPLREQ